MRALGALLLAHAATVALAYATPAGTPALAAAPRTSPVRLAVAAVAPFLQIQAAEEQDAWAVSCLCTDSFFGTHELSDGPVIWAQRASVLTRVLGQIRRRVAMGEGRECRLMVGTDSESGEVRACCDIAIHLFDTRYQRFELMTDEVPADAERDRYVWRPYVASMAVNPLHRRSGIGKEMLQEAERVARQWGYDELMLEVACDNSAAIDFYNRNGYELVRRTFDPMEEGATVVRVKYGLYWQIEQVEKYLMRKSLAAPSRLAPITAAFRTPWLVSPRDR